MHTLTSSSFVNAKAAQSFCPAGVGITESNVMQWEDATIHIVHLMFAKRKGNEKFSNQRRSSKKNCSLLSHYDALVCHCWHICSSSRARAHHNSNLKRNRKLNLHRSISNTETSLPACLKYNNKKKTLKNCRLIILILCIDGIISLYESFT